MQSLEERIRHAVEEEVGIVPYDSGWPEVFRREKEHLLSCLPADLVRRIEHFGSTAVPGLAAKPIVDILVEVTDLEATRTRIVPLLEARGYEALKYRLAAAHPNDRVAYTAGKTAFIARVTEQARRLFGKV